VATLLPGTAFFPGLALRPARKLIDRGVPVALASDCNPGTCMTENLPLVGDGLHPDEDAAAELSPPDAQRRRRAGPRSADRFAGSRKQADLVIFDVPDYRHFFYHFGVNHVWRVVKRGRVVCALGAGPC